jgi:ElaB/YqjD/DUF883 family membrane-anchored ribosome-binding protein
MSKADETSVSQRTRSTSDYVHRGIDRAAEALHDTTENAAASAVKLAGRADRGVDALRKKQKRIQTETINYATKYPLRSIAISLGIGFIVARLIK